MVSVRVFFTFIIKVLTASLVFLYGCATVNDHDILLNEPYNKVTYVSHPAEEGYHTVDIVQLTARGSQSNILNTIPQLYLRAQERAKREDVFLGNIQITSFTKIENEDVPYRRCVYIPVELRIPQNLCSPSPCKQEYERRYTYRKNCWTEYRTESREVLCQKVTAELLSKTEKE